MERGYTGSWPAPIHSPPLSPQVACPYVGCGESFADHSTIHAQVSVVAGARVCRQAGRQPRVQSPLQLPPCSISLPSAAVSVKRE